MQLQAMQEEAIQDAQQFAKFDGDWRTQIMRLNEISAKVGRWQKTVFKAFGNPEYHFEKLKPGTVFGARYEPDSLRFKGATLTQQQIVKHDEEKAVVRYGAWLHTNENQFLTEMLPQTTILQHDPIYQLYDLTIVIPRGELVGESLRLISEKFSKTEKGRRWFGK